MNNYNINVVLCRSRSPLDTYSDGDAQIYQNLIINNSKKLFVLWTRTMTKKKKKKRCHDHGVNSKETPRASHVFSLAWSFLNCCMQSQPAGEFFPIDVLVLRDVSEGAVVPCASCRPPEKALLLVCATIWKTSDKSFFKNSVLLMNDKI